MNKLSFSLYVECCFCSIQHRAMSRSGVQGPEQAAFFLGPWLNCCNIRDERDLRFASPRSLSHREVSSECCWLLWPAAVCCCGHSTVSAPHSTVQHHSLSLPYFPSPWRRLVWAHPARPCTRTTALHQAHLGAGKRTGAQCGAAEAQCRHRHTTAKHWHHTHNFHYLLTFIGPVHGGNTVDGSAPCRGGGRIHFQNTVNTEYVGIFSKERLEVARAIFVVISSTLFIRWSLLNESAAREATKKFDN